MIHMVLWVGWLVGWLVGLFSSFPGFYKIYRVLKGVYYRICLGHLTLSTWLCWSVGLLFLWFCLGWAYRGFSLFL